MAARQERVLIVWDDNYDCLWALPVEYNGPVDWVVKWVVDELGEIEESR